MATQNLETNEMCDVDENVAGILKKLKFNKNKKNAAVMLKIVVAEDKIIIDEEYEDTSVEELQEELPERQPRYLVYSFKHATKDGRTMYPFCFIYYNPSGCNPQQVMRYAGCRNKVLHLSGCGNSLELVDKENLTDEWLVARMKLP